MRLWVRRPTGVGKAAGDFFGIGVDVGSHVGFGVGVGICEASVVGV